MKDYTRIAEIIKNGGVGVFPTDTLYGLIGSALIPQAVEKIYEIKGREETKPFIVLISNLSDLKVFGIKLTDAQKGFLHKVWPGEVSVILPIAEESQEKLKYLHRGVCTLAFRSPNKLETVTLLNYTGPLVAPSTNPTGAKPAETIEEAWNYFSNKVGFYEDVGQLSAPPSTLVDLTNDEIKILRQGRVIV
ncbi:MAG: L-threonylcarbamoyladenylate synthase [bacterium]